MKRRRFLSTLGGLVAFSSAGCSTSSEGDSTTITNSASTPSITSISSQSPEFTSVDVSELGIPGKLNPLSVLIHYAHLDTKKQYSVQFITESEAGEKTVNHEIERKKGIYPGLTGFRADAPDGTATDGSATLVYTAILQEEDTKMDTERGSIFSYE